MRAFIVLCFVAAFAIEPAFAQTTTPSSTINVGELLAPWLQILVAAFGACVVALLGWATAVFNRKAGLEGNAAVLQAEAHMRELLQTALENAAGRVVMVLGDKLKDAKLDVKSPIIVDAVKALNQSALAAVNHFGLTPEKVAEKIIAKLGVITASNPQVAPTASL